MKNVKRSFWQEIGFVLLLSSVCVTLLLVTRKSVGGRSQVSPATVMTILTMLANRAPESEQQAFTLFNRRFQQVRTGKIKLWQNQDITRQWAFEATGAAMWGEITIAGMLDLETSTLLGLKVINQSETAGLGSKVADPAFCEQFSGLSFRPRVEMSRARAKNNQFDAVSGATVTSKALENLLNKTIQEILKHS
jgi:Na+-translocating ferredoxin:NAD+ oxidoreductase RnfG subunit